MYKLAFLFFVALLLFSCKQTLSISENELKEIYNGIIKSDSVKRRFYLVDSIENFSEKSITQSDTTYFIADNSDLKKGVWIKGIIDSAVLVSDNYLLKIAKSDAFSLTPRHYNFSLPYFSKDRQSFLIYYDYYCGNLCGEYSLRLYKKINGTWVYIKSYLTMVS